MGIPSWLETAALWVGGVIGAVALTRSEAKRKIDEAIAQKQRELEEVNSGTIHSQGQQLQALSTEVDSLRGMVAGLTELNQRYVKAMADKDLRIGELQRDIRIRDITIGELEHKVAELLRQA